MATPDRHGALDRQLELLESSVRETVADDRDVHSTLQPDRQGIGVAAGRPTSSP